MTGAEVAVLAAAAPEIAAGTAAATGMTAAGLGAAGTAAGTAAAGLGGGTAAMFRPMALGAGASPLAASMAAPAAVPALAGMGGGTAAMFGPAAAGASPLAVEMAGVAPAAGPGLPWAKMAGQMGKGLLQDGGQQQPQPSAQRPGQTAQPLDSAELMQRLRQQRAQRNNWSGLLGQAMGRV